MSLINQMLRDLEVRRGAVAQPNDAVLDGLTSAGVWTGPAARPLPWVVLAATGVVAAMLLLVPLPGDPPAPRLRQAPPLRPVATTAPLAGRTAVPSLPAPAMPRPSPSVSGGEAATAPDPRQVTAELRAFASSLEAATGIPPREDTAGVDALDPRESARTATVPDRHAAEITAETAAVREVAPAPAIDEFDLSGPDAPGDALSDAHLAAATDAATVERPGTFRREQAVLAAPTAGDIELARALNLLTGGQRERGLNALRAYVLGHPHARAARVRYARELLMAERGTEAEAVLRTGLRLMPGAADLARLLAHLLFDRGEPALALRVLLGAAPPVASDPDYHAFVAALHQQAGDHAAAVAAYRSVLSVQADNGSAWLGLGISLAAGNAPREARTAFGRMLADTRLSPAIREFARQEVARLEHVR